MKKKVKNSESIPEFNNNLASLSKDREKFIDNFIEELSKLKMKHREEYKEFGTCQGWSESDTIPDNLWDVKLMFKDVHGMASQEEMVAIEICYLLGYNNVDHIPKDEVLYKAGAIVTGKQIGRAHV